MDYIKIKIKPQAIMKFMYLLFIIVLPRSIFGQSIKCENLSYQSSIESFKKNKLLIDSVLQSDRQSINSIYSKWNFYPRLNIYLKGNDFKIKNDTDEILIYNRLEHSSFKYNIYNPKTIVPQKTIPLFETLSNKVNYFFVYFLDAEKERYDIIAFCDNNSVVFKTSDSNVLSSIESIIKNRYGSVEKYRELYDDQESLKKNLINLRVNDKENAIKTILNSWQLRSKYIPLDTVGNVTLLVNSIAHSTNLTVEQIKLLRIKIFNLLTQYKELNISDIYSCNEQFNIYGFDIQNIILEVLTKKQYNECLIYFKAMQIGLHMSENFIFSNIIDTKVVRPDINNTQDYEEKIKNLFKSNQ
ncbi:MAG: hypothetical protein JSS98_03405 [Bacteroidetes bacterium]|nr:hypothetical protein [Bacteroidota bacterium]